MLRAFSASALPLRVAVRPACALTSLPRCLSTSAPMLAKRMPAAAPPLPKAKAQQTSVPLSSSVATKGNGAASSAAGTASTPQQQQAAHARGMATAEMNAVAAAAAAEKLGLKPSPFSPLSPKPTQAELDAAKPAFASRLEGFVARQFKNAREYGPAGVAVWTLLYLAPGVGCYQLLLHNDNFGWSVAQLLEMLPVAVQEWLITSLQAMLKMVNIELPVTPAPAVDVLANGSTSPSPSKAAASLNLNLQPWQTSAVLGWMFTELIEPARFVATIWIVKKWKAKKAELNAGAAPTGTGAGGLFK